MTKFAAFTLWLIVLVISSIYKVNSAPQYPLYPEYPKRFQASGGPGFRALGVNYTTICHISIIVFLLYLLCSINRSITNINGIKYTY